MYSVIDLSIASLLRMHKGMVYTMEHVLMCTHNLWMCSYFQERSCQATLMHLTCLIAFKAYILSTLNLCHPTILL